MNMNKLAKLTKKVGNGGNASPKRTGLLHSLVSCAIFAGVLLFAMYALNIAGMNTAEKLISDWYARTSGMNP